MIDATGAPRVPSGNVADPGPIVNAGLNVNKWAEVYGEDPTNTDPEVYAYLPGRWGGFAIAADSEALTDNATNYIVVARSTGVLSVATTNTNWNNSTDYARVARIVLASGARTDDEDFRAGPGGVHGGGSGGGGANTTQTKEMMCGFIATAADKDYRFVLKAAHAGTITETTTRSESGTCTATFKVNTTALGGTVNSVSTSEQSQAHASSNTFAEGDDLVLTVSANSSCLGLSFTIKYTRTLES